MSHGGMTAEQAQAYKRLQLGSYVKPADEARILAIRNAGGYSRAECEQREEKERMLAAIEEVRWESGADYNSAMHTVLDVLQYLVERT
ncbi:hypothetical protein uav_160 [Pseudomonas phage UAVern]|uniref:Uncharacterized protein n=1 Tax=Pseudomonas phage UAVern TaxID=2856997 RepID=A0A975UUC5_9CAUD|nr:hypothetical protein uav_160 [Pseudomonas phage UAVern]